MVDPERRKLAAYYRDLFEDDKRGQAVFEDLLKRFGGTKVHVDGGIDAVLKTYRSAAYREVLDYMVRMINAGNGVDEPQPEGENDVS